MAEPAGRGEAVLGAVAFATERFLRDEVWHERIDEVLARLGEAAAVDRSYLCQNVRGADGRLWMDLRNQWQAPGVPRLLGTEDSTLRPYAPDFVRWLDLLGRGEVVHGRLSDLPSHERPALDRDGVVSLAVVPVAVDDEWWGYIGFDDCREERAWSEIELAGLRAAAGALGAAIGRQRADERDRFAQDQYRSMVEHGPAVLYVDAVSEHAATLYIGPQVELLLGYRPEEWTGDPDLWLKVLHPDDRARALAENARHNETGEPFSLEYRMIGKDKRVVWVLDEATMVRDERGMPRYSLGVMIDISERKRNEGEVAFLTYHDPLTGLPSYAMFEELLELSIARARRHDASVGVVCLDIDQLRLVNDSLGHGSGDAILRMVADRLREATRETDLVARRGGDEFLLLLADVERGRGEDRSATMLRAEAAVQRIQDAMRPPFLLAGSEFYLSVTMGVGLFPYDADDTAGLVRNADAAMRESKRTGPGSYLLSAQGRLDSGAKLELVTRLRRAVDAQRWVLHYQPVVELESARVVGVEALIRWIEPDGTLVPPGEFIPLAEELGLIETIGEWVMGELAHQTEVWRDLGIDLEVGFNLSPREFLHPDLSRRILESAGRGGLRPERLVVEITESSAMVDPTRALEVLWELHRGGVKIAIDDFGTGYSSLSRLRELPVDILKIDRSFVSGVDRDPQNASIVAAFIQLAEGLGMTTLAEGIETEDELAFLVERGCRLGQGYLFSRPVPPEEIIALVLGGARVKTRSG